MTTVPLEPAINELPFHESDKQPPFNKMFDMDVDRFHLIPSYEYPYIEAPPITVIYPFEAIQYPVAPDGNMFELQAVQLIPSAEAAIGLLPLPHAIHTRPFHAIALQLPLANIVLPDVEEFHLNPSYE